MEIVYAIVSALMLLAGSPDAAESTEYEGSKSRAIRVDLQDDGRQTEEIPPVTEWTDNDLPKVPVQEEKEIQPKWRYAASDKEIDCLASAVYYEARGEPLQGRVAIVEVILARRDSGRWAKTACAVIAQKSQFSFVSGGHIPRLSQTDHATYRSLVKRVLTGELSSPARGATYFHARHAKPSWRLEMQRVSMIGSHYFYKT